MSLSQEDKALIDIAGNVIRKNYDRVNWWHTVGAAVCCRFWDKRDWG